MRAVERKNIQWKSKVKKGCQFQISFKYIDNAWLADYP